MQATFVSLLPAAKPGTKKKEVQTSKTARKSTKDKNERRIFLKKNRGHFCRKKTTGVTHNRYLRENSRNTLAKTYSDLTKKIPSFFLSMVAFCDYDEDHEVGAKFSAFIVLVSMLGADLVDPTIVSSNFFQLKS